MSQPNQPCMNCIFCVNGYYELCRGPDQTTAFEQHAYGRKLHSKDEATAVDSTWQELLERNRKSARRDAIIGNVLMCCFMLALFTSPIWLHACVARFNG